MPEKLVSWLDIARGVGQVAMQTLAGLVKQVAHEPKPYESDHYQGPPQTVD